jgi:hypothetical protein
MPQETVNYLPNVASEYSKYWTEVHATNPSKSTTRAPSYPKETTYQKWQTYIEPKTK